MHSMHEAPIAGTTPAGDVLIRTLAGIQALRPGSFEQLSDLLQTVVATTQLDTTAPIMIDGLPELAGRAALSSWMPEDAPGGDALQLVAFGLLFALPVVPKLITRTDRPELDNGDNGTQPSSQPGGQQASLPARVLRDLIELRCNRHRVSRGLCGARTVLLVVDDRVGLIALLRQRDGGPRDDVLALANVSPRPILQRRIGVPRSGLWRVRLNTRWHGYSDARGVLPVESWCTAPDPADGMPYSIEVPGLVPWSCSFLSQDE